MEKVTLGYWKIRGLGQFIRHLLAYTGVEFQEIQYDSQDKWFKEDKVSLGFEFPNLPYLVDGAFKLTESAAIAKYIINKSGKTDLLGKNSQDKGKVDALIALSREIGTTIVGLCFNPEHEKVKIEILEKVRPKLNYIKEFIGDKQFALGYLTLVDFYLAEQLSYFETFFPSEHKNFGYWWRIRHNFEELEEIRSYYKRPDAIVGPYLPASSLVPIVGKKVRHGYWGIRGLGQANRLLLAYSGVEFEDTQYSDPDKWFKEDKLNIGLDFPNLPYLIDGEYSLTESTAIQRYIIQKWGEPELAGKNAQDNAKLEAFLSIFTEFSGAVTGLFFNKDHATAKGPLFEKHKAKLEQLASFVGDKSFVLGYLTLADFVVSEGSVYIETIYPEESKAFPFLKRVRENFNQVPKIAEYNKSEKAFKGPYMPPTAFLSVEK